MKQIWDNKHDKYAKTSWIDKPTLFAQSILKYFPASGTVLDLGGGQGQDARYFANKGYDVTLTDLSDNGLKYAQEKTPDNLKIKIKQHDISTPLPWPDKSFDIVYSHMAVHYFDHQTTIRLFDEIYRVLKNDGTLALLVNSIHDPEYKTGTELEPNFYKIGEKTKRYFSADTLKQYITKFKTILLDEHGETYKDRAVNNDNLTRFVGKK